MNTALASFRDRHAGATVVVCGCGPSLNTLPDPRRWITIGVNDVGRLFDPTYLVVVNPPGQFKGDRFRFVAASRARALFTQLDLGPVAPPVVRFRLGQYAGTDTGRGEALHYTQNSPYVAVMLAALMGARRIGLIGVDLTDGHFFGGQERHVLAPRLQEIDAQYGRLAAALGRRGIELVNLGGGSRLRALPRCGPGWLEGSERAEAEPGQGTDIARSEAMRISIEKRSKGVVSDLLDTLAATATGLGHAVSRDPRRTAADPRVLSVVWNGRGHLGRGPTLYCEHGWLPRADYQISPQGINADSHAAPFHWDGRPLSEADSAALDARLAAIKSASFDGHYQYMQAGGEAAPGLPADFLLVPLQIESDTNIVRHAPANLRTMQALVDHVSRIDPPWPVIFKQHPADARTANRHLLLRMRRPQDRLWPQSRGNIHQMLKGGACRGIVTLNSNVAHDGLLWDVPALVLGRNVWPSSGACTPFLTAWPRDWSQLQASVTQPEAVACRRAYAHHLIRHQWRLEDARDPQRVAALLASVGPRAAAPAPARRGTAPLRRAGEPVINVVAENKGWLFEHWKQALAAARLPQWRIAATPRPLRDAQAWIFIRAREAERAPDPSRALVQIHDALDEGRYAAGGERAAVARCGALSLTHPAQRGVLEGAGIDLSRRLWQLNTPGWSGKPGGARRPGGALPWVAWVGRPAVHDGVDASGLHGFVAGARVLQGRAHLVLVGERLSTAAAALRAAGIDCRVHGLREFPMASAAEWLSRFDAVAIGGGPDAGPWPLFDALHAGVPVAATRHGWCEALLGDGGCGRLVDDASQLGEALLELATAQAAWRDAAPRLAASVRDRSLAAWVQGELQLAARLAGLAVRSAA
jgi:hypothetical protein